MDKKGDLFIIPIRTGGKAYREICHTKTGRSNDVQKNLATVRNKR